MYNCSLCEYKSNKKYNLNRHMVVKHNNNNDKNVITGNKCSKILSSKQYLEKTLLHQPKKINETKLLYFYSSFCLIYLFRLV